MADFEEAKSNLAGAVALIPVDSGVTVAVSASHIHETLKRIERDAARTIRLESALILVIKQLEEELSEETPGWWHDLIGMCREALYG